MRRLRRSGAQVAFAVASSIAFMVVLLDALTAGGGLDTGAAVAFGDALLISSFLTIIFGFLVGKFLFPLRRWR